MSIFGILRNLLFYQFIKNYLLERKLGQLNPSQPVISFSKILNNISSGGKDASFNQPHASRNLSDNYLDTAIQHISQKYKISPSLTRAVIKVESGFNPNAVSRKGAMGLMQLMPETARELGVKDPFDPAENIEGGVKYLRQMIDRFDDLRLALAAYNAGPGSVQKYGGIPPYRETQQYVTKVLNELNRLDLKV